MPTPRELEHEVATRDHIHNTHVGPFDQITAITQSALNSQLHFLVNDEDKMQGIKFTQGDYSLSLKMPKDKHPTIKLLTGLSGQYVMYYMTVGVSGVSCRGNPGG